MEMQETLTLEQFRIEPQASGTVHLIFDAPGRTMNVFSNAAIRDLNLFADWVKGTAYKGIVVRSGKTTAFCAGADLGELGQAYGMIMAAPQEQRFQLAFDHFFTLSQGVRKLETCGKPVAVAIAGLALGGGCEFALGGHYRVLADTPLAALGLPESLVGLLPGAGGTQRFPRLAGMEAALPVLLEGGRLAGQAAIDAGVANELVPLGQEVEAAERWVLTTETFGQPWDEPTWFPKDIDTFLDLIDAKRAEVLSRTLGHYPAPLAILDCLEFGYPQEIDLAIRTEMEIFSRLIQRPEPRDMIATMFVAKTDYERKAKKNELPAAVPAAAAAIAAVWQDADPAALAAAGFTKTGAATPAPDADAERTTYWYERAPLDERKRLVAAVLDKVEQAAIAQESQVAQAERALVDYALVTQFGFPAYLGGAFALRAARK